MSDINTVLQALGRIEGKLDSEIDLAKEHRDDDKRRFTEVYTVLNQHAEDINQAKGAKGAILWGASAIASVLSVLAGLAIKYFTGGGH